MSFAIIAIALGETLQYIYTVCTLPMYMIFNFAIIPCVMYVQMFSPIYNLSSPPLHRPPLSTASLLWRLREDVLVQVLHDLDDQLEAVHEGVDGDAQHAVRRGPVVDLQHLRVAAAAAATCRLG